MIDQKPTAAGWWPGDHKLVTGTRDDCGMREANQEDLEALNNLVQDGLIEVVGIDGEPSSRLASRFTVDLKPLADESD